MKIKLEDVNGIGQLTVAMDVPGVYVARGQNGAGKSSTIEAIKAAAGDKKAKAEPTDGCQRGKVEVEGGVILAVGRRRTSTGQPTIQLVSESPLAQLIDPGIQDPELANKARLKALLELVPLRPTKEAFEDLTGGLPEITGPIDMTAHRDLLSLAERVREVGNREALAKEKEAQQYAGGLAKIEEDIRRFPLEAKHEPTGRPTKNEVLIKVKEVGRLEMEVKAREQTEHLRESIRQNLAGRPNVEATQKALSDCESARAAAQDVFMAAKQALEKHSMAVEIAEKLHEKTEADAVRWDEMNAKLLQKIEGASRGELEKATAELEQMQRDASIEEQRQTVATLRASLEATRRDKIAVEASACRLREQVKKAGNVLGRAIEAEGIENVSVVDGKLCGFIDGYWRDFQERLSFGQRVRLALGVALSACKHAGSTAILALDPKFWLALDAERRSEVARWAGEMGVYVVTEEPTAGPLRVERAQEKEVEL